MTAVGSTEPWYRRTYLNDAYLTYIGLSIPAEVTAAECAMVELALHVAPLPAFWTSRAGTGGTQ